MDCTKIHWVLTGSPPKCSHNIPWEIRNPFTPPGKINMSRQGGSSQKVSLIFQPSIFRGYDSFQGDKNVEKTSPQNMTKLQYSQYATSLVPSQSLFHLRLSRPGCLFWVKTGDIPPVEHWHTVDGRNPAITSWYGKYTIINRILYIPGGCLGFLPSTVCIAWFLPR